MTLLEFLDSYLEGHSNLTDIELARRLGYVGNNSVSSVRRGERKIPEDRIKDWADALELTGVRRDEFIELAHLDLATSHLQQQYFHLKGRIDQLERDKRSHIDEIQDLKILLAELKRRRETN